MIKLKWIVSMVCALALNACSDDNNRVDNNVPTVAAIYDTTTAELPFPNAIYQGDDGRLALPLAAGVAAGDLSNATVALNTLDGFSTIAPIRISFAEDIDASSILAGDSVRLVQVSVDTNGLPSTQIKELDSSEFIAVRSAVESNTVLIKPLLPLQSASNYVVIYTNGLVTESGLKTASSEDYARLRDGQVASNSNLDEQQLSALIKAQESLAISLGVAQSDIVATTSFRTHSTTALLQRINDNATAVNYSLQRPNMTVDGVVQRLTTLPLDGLASIFGLTKTGQVDVYTGLIDMPYYMNIPTSPTDDSVNDGFFKNAQGNAVLAGSAIPQSNTLTVPIMVGIPNPSVDSGIVKPANGWPVAIYHHGITANRTNMLLIADSLAAQGVAMVAIDQPVHGVIPNDANILPLSVFASFNVSFYDAANERHFNLDLNGDGQIDLAGANFSSPRNQLTSRDNLRQSVSDLAHLAKTLAVMSLPGDSSLAFDANKIHFVSLSLGSIVGTQLAGVNSDIKAFSLSAPGAGGIKFTESAPNGNAGVIASLAALGFTQGEQDYENYLTLLTTIAGPGDPINYSAKASELHPIHLTQIIGDGTEQNPPDQTIASEVLDIAPYAGLVKETAPLSGTEPMVRVMGLADVFSTVSNSGGVRGVVRFLRGDHQSQLNPSNLLSPFAVPEVTQEMHLQTASFIASGGAQIEVGNTGLVDDNFFPAELR